MIIGIVAAAAAIWILSLFFLFRYAVGYAERRMAGYQNDLMQKHGEEVEHMYRQTRGWRHDLKTHIQTLKAYMALHEYRKLEEYLGKLDTDLESVDQIVKTGNLKIDALLNSKLSLARARAIQVECKAIVPQELPVSEVDLGIVIGNLMDNAMEACQKIEEEEKRFLRVYIDVMKGSLYIYVINSMEGKPEKTGRYYRTTKSVRDHGYGLLRMDQVVKKHHGFLDRQNEEGIFATEVLLPLTQETGKKAES